MNKAFEKILDRLEDLREGLLTTNTEYNSHCVDAMMRAGQIVQEVAKEYKNGWIPCSEMLPEDGVPVLLQDFGGYYSLGVSETKRNIKGFRDGDWWGSANNYKAWQPLPEPYEEKE